MLRFAGAFAIAFVAAASAGTPGAAEPLPQAPPGFSGRKRVALLFGFAAVLIGLGLGVKGYRRYTKLLTRARPYWQITRKLLIAPPCL